MVLAAETLIDSYDLANRSTYTQLYYGSNIGAGQIFNVTENYNLTTMAFCLAKSGSPEALYSVKIYNLSGYPYDPIATSESLDISTTTTTFTMYNFSFTGENQILLSKGEAYISFLSLDSYTLFNSTNQLRIGYDSTSPTNYGYYSTGTAANRVTQTAYDAIFSLYGEPTEGPTTGISEEEVETAIAIAVMLSVIIASSVVGVVTYARKK